MRRGVFTFASRQFLAPLPTGELTILVTTSPIPSHPSTVLLRTLFRSFQHLGAQFPCLLARLLEAIAAT